MLIDTTVLLNTVTEITHKFSPFPAGTLLVSWDVISMYPSIDNEVSLAACKEALDRREHTLGRLILALVKFCDFQIFRFSVYLNLANSWKISDLEKMVSDMVFSKCDSTCVKLKRVTTCMKILYLVNP